MAAGGNGGAAGKSAPAVGPTTPSRGRHQRAITNTLPYYGLYKSGRSEAELYPYCAFNGSHICGVERSEPSVEPLLACCRDLICHGLAASSVEGDVCFTRVESAHIAGERNHLDAIECRIGRIVAENDRRPTLANFTAERAIENHPPDLSPSRRRWVAHDLDVDVESSRSPSAQTIAARSRSRSAAMAA